MEKVKFFICIMLISSNLFAQKMSPEQEAVQRQIEEIMKNREEMFRSLLNDDSFKEMEKRMQEMMKRFGGEDFNFNSESIFGGAIVGEYDWLEDEKYKTLKLKVTQIKDRPLDIKIEKGQIKIKGDVETVNEGQKGKTKKTTSKVHFERVFSIPAGVDDKNPEFDNKDGELFIKFKKIKQGKVKSVNAEKSKIEASENNNDRVPINPDDKDISF